MDMKLVKRFVLLVALLMLVVCLPATGLAADETRTTKWVTMVGQTEWVNPASDWDDKISPYITGSMAEKNEKLVFTLEKVGKGIKVLEKSLTYTEETNPYGYTYEYAPYIQFEVSGKEDVTLVYSVFVKPENKTYRMNVEFDVLGVIKTPAISATAATKPVKEADGNYSMTAEEGSFITITPSYEDLNGKKLAMEIEWTTYDYEEGQSNELSTQNTHTFEITKDLDGDDLEWAAYLPSVGYGDYRWIHITVVPKGTLTTSSAPAASVPSTGDSAAPMLWLVGMLMAGAGCAVLTMKRRQNG